MFPRIKLAPGQSENVTPNGYSPRHEDDGREPFSCSKCDAELYPSPGDQTCECGTSYNAFGQRLREGVFGFNDLNEEDDYSDYDY